MLLTIADAVFTAVLPSILHVLSSTTSSIIVCDFKALLDHQPSVNPILTLLTVIVLRCISRVLESKVSPADA